MKHFLPRNHLLQVTADSQWSVNQPYLMRSIWWSLMAWPTSATGYVRGKTLEWENFFTEIFCKLINLCFIIHVGDPSLETFFVLLSSPCCVAFDEGVFPLAISLSHFLCDFGNPVKVCFFWYQTRLKWTLYKFVSLKKLMTA